MLRWHFVFLVSVSIFIPYGQAKESALPIYGLQPDGSYKSFPLDLAVVPFKDLGKRGGSFVYGTTSSPATFNPIKSSEAFSSFQVANLLYATLVDWDRFQKDFVPLLASWKRVNDLTWKFRLRRGIKFSNGDPITSTDVKYAFDLAMDPSLPSGLRDDLQIEGQPFKVTAPDLRTIVIKTAKRYRFVLGVVMSVRIYPKKVFVGQLTKNTLENIKLHSPKYLSDTVFMDRVQKAIQTGSFSKAFEDSSEREVFSGAFSNAFFSSYGIGTPPNELITSGPFMLSQVVPNEKVVLTRNPYWFRFDSMGLQLPYLDKVIFRIVSDQDTLQPWLKTKEIDAFEQTKPADYTVYEDDKKVGGYQVYNLGPLISANMLYFNLNKFRDPEIAARNNKRVGDTYLESEQYTLFNKSQFRCAVSKAIDRNSIIRGAYSGEGVNNWSFATPSSQWYSKGIKGPDEDLEAARADLKKLGLVETKDEDNQPVLKYPSGKQVQFYIQVPSQNKVRVEIANRLRDDLARVGIKVVPSPIDFNTFAYNQRIFHFEATLSNWSFLAGPDDIPAQFRNTLRSSGSQHLWNATQPHPETEAEAAIDREIDINLSTFDVEEQKRSWHEIERVMNENCFLIWLPVQNMKVPISNRIGNAMPSPIPHRILWNIEWMFEKYPAKK